MYPGRACNGNVDFCRSIDLVNPIVEELQLNISVTGKNNIGYWGLATIRMKCDSTLNVSLDESQFVTAMEFEYNETNRFYDIKGFSTPLPVKCPIKELYFSDGGLQKKIINELTFDSAVCQ